MLENSHSCLQALKVSSKISFEHLLGNLHFNVTSKTFNYDLKKMIDPFLYEWVQGHKGSISAEHGLGFMKNTHIHYSKSPSAVRLMKDIKKLMDPNGILNPYKMFLK